MAENTKKVRPSIRALGADISNDTSRPAPAPVKKAPPPAKPAKRQEEEEEDDDENDGMVPGKIPANVRPLQSDAPAGLVPRYQAALDSLLDARGEQRTARLSFKQLGDEGAEKMAGLLKTGTCRSLTGLDISCNSIGVAGCKAIASSLSSNTAIISLDLSANAIGDEGASALANALAFNSTLQNIDLHACSIGDEGAAALANVLIDGNITVSGLNLKANYIKDGGAKKLAEAVLKSRSLRCMITTSNDIEREGQMALDRAFEQNLKCSPKVTAGEHDNIVGEVCAVM
eukprot:CAMPEP_0173437088 /NCGR_PEP_ID=MMETSP1357-20121228/17842_1 /TAXON_ID=77926 /ORGANISM="Hemiselmis rufescens, Strain PCC563" /LENGTH=286 /DNA_ID=CAMNT_0014402249 /DNA_START=10 /DNA_END=870 /DNA_ORIENTATION=+